MKKSLNSAKKQRLIFYISMAMLPVIQFLIFYVYLNFRSFTMAFQTFDSTTGKFYFSGFEQFSQVVSDWQTQPYLARAFINSLEIFVLHLIFGSLLAVVFSYYVFKKFPLSGVFKIILYLPHIVSTVVFVIIYMYFVDSVIPEVLNSVFGVQDEGLLADVSNMQRVKTTIIFFTIMISFGTQVLLYSGAMSGISESVLESAQLDGISQFRELISIIIPLIWSVFTTFMVVSVAGLFTNQMSLFAFYGTEAEFTLWTFGYYLYREIYKATTGVVYPYLSAIGLMMTAVAVPLTLIVKKLMEKFGPSVE